MRKKMKKIILYVVFYLVVLIGGMLKDVYVGTGYRSIEARITWDEAYNNLPFRLILSGVILLLAYYFLDYRYSKKEENISDDSGENPSSTKAEDKK